MFDLYSKGSDWFRARATFRICAHPVFRRCYSGAGPRAGGVDANWWLIVQSVRIIHPRARQSSCLPSTQTPAATTRVLSSCARMRMRGARPPQEPEKRQASWGFLALCANSLKNRSLLQYNTEYTGRRHLAVPELHHFIQVRPEALQENLVVDHGDLRQGRVDLSYRVMLNHRHVRFERAGKIKRGKGEEDKARTRRHPIHLCRFSPYFERS